MANMTPEQRRAHRRRLRRLRKMSPEALKAYRQRIARRQAEPEKVQAPKPQLKIQVPTPEPPKRQGRRRPPKAQQQVTIKVGAVEATVGAGKDKRLGTPDDTVKLAKAGTADYSTLLVKQLREEAKKRGLAGYGKMTKAQLVRALKKADAGK